MIPALVAEGIDWVLVDNIHFDRACVGYPHTNASCIYSPNKADQINPDPAASGGAWVQLNNLWAPVVSACRSDIARIGCNTSILRPASLRK